MTVLDTFTRYQSAAFFVTLTAIAAACFFAASMTAFVVLPMQSFANISAALALGTVVGALLQCGAAYSMPRAAFVGRQQRDKVFRKTLFASAILGAGVACAALVLPMHSVVRAGLVLGAFIGVQLVCDSYARARGALGFLGALNAGLHAGLLLVIGLAVLRGQLDAPFFIGAVVFVKLSFVIATLWRFGLPGPFADHDTKHRLRDGLLAQLAIATVFLLGVTDVLILRTMVSDAPDFVALRHFGYGFFLLIVQESAIPLMTERLVARQTFRKRAIAWLAAGLAALVGVAAVVVVCALALIRGDALPSMALIMAISASLAAHSFAVFAFYYAFAIGTDLRRQIVTALAAVAFMTMCTALFDLGLPAIISAVAAINILFALGSLLPNHTEEQQIGE